MPDITKLWDKRYLFGPNSIDLTRSDHVFFWASLVFVAAAIIAKILAWREQESSPKKFLMSRFYRAFLTMGFLILLWTGARFENIPWLSTHIVVLFLFLIWVAWLFFVGKYFLKEYRGQQESWKSEQVKRKYL